MHMKNSIQSEKVLTKEEMRKVMGGFGPGEQCGTQVCSKYQACCTRESASGGTVYYCTTTACE
jgi:hypothetical protein